MNDYSLLITMRTIEGFFVNNGGRYAWKLKIYYTTLTKNHLKVKLLLKFKILSIRELVFTYFPNPSGWFWRIATYRSYFPTVFTDVVRGAFRRQNCNASRFILTANI